MRHYRNHCFTVIWALLLLVLISTASLAGTIYVKTTGSDSNNGSSWDLAKRTVQAGINAAVSGDEVWVAGGAYAERVNLTAGVSLYGGYSGSGATRDIALYETTIDGSGSGAGSAVTVQTGATNATVVDGFTFHNTSRPVNGGGINAGSAAPTISHNKFTNCKAQYGGAVYVSSQTGAVITNNTFTGNEAYGIYSGGISSGGWGGAIYGDTCTSLQISDNVITQNTSKQPIAGGWQWSDGPAIYLTGCPSATVSGNGIRSNQGNGGPGLYCKTGAYTITGNAVIGNSGFRALYLTSVDLTLSGNTIKYNNTNTGSAVYMFRGRTNGFPNTIAGNTIENNEGDGIFFNLESSTSGKIITVSGNRVFCNTVRGIYGTNSSSTIAGNVVAGNGSHGLYLTFTTATVRGNTMYGNADYGMNLGSSVLCAVSNNIVAFGQYGISWINRSDTFLNNCVYGNSMSDWSGLGDPGVDGNISQDPKLADDHVHLQPDSPCINAGTNSTVPGGDTDIDGQDRIQNTTVDMGADESNGDAWPAQPPSIVMVSPTGNDENDGSGWDDAHAKATVAAAVCAAFRKGAGSEVWVKAGEYPNPAYAAAIYLQRNVYLYGGFAGDETERSQRDIAHNASTLTAEVDVWGNAGNLISCFDGFTLRNWLLGIRMTCGGNTYFRNNTVLGCRFALGYASPVITDNVIKDYSSHGISGGNSSPTILRNRIENCGGGVQFSSGTGITIADNTIIGCTKTGGIVLSALPSCTISGNTITGNVCNSVNGSGQGGGICCTGAGSGTISGNIISGNSAAIRGGGIYTETSPYTVQNNLIIGNRSGAEGDGIYMAAAGSQIINNTIVGNFGTSGGGLHLGSSSATVRNNIVAFNNSGIWTPSTPTLANNCVYGNTEYNYRNTSPGPTDISVDPKLASMAYGNYRLRGDSPCIDAGTSTDAPAVDIMNTARPQDGDCDGVTAYDIGAYEHIFNFEDAKKYFADGRTVVFSGYSVTGNMSGPNCIYAENAGRNTGIRIDTANTFTEGAVLGISGTVQTDTATGERYIQPAAGYPAPTGSTLALKPIALTSRDLGGETAGMQAGMATGSGVNNIGLLVKTWGLVVGFDDPDAPVSWFKISDGSNWVSDGSQVSAKVKAPTGVTINKKWQWVLVTGISSCEKDELGNIQRVIRVRRQSDIVPIITAP